MIFSRYVGVLRAAGKLLQPNVLEKEVKSERTFSKTTSLLRCCNALEKSRTDVPNVTGKSKESSIIIKNNENNNAEQNVLQFTSKSATAFVASAIDECSATDTFGSNFFIDDIGRMIEENESEAAKSSLDTCDDDLSHITPNHMPSFNIAAYANNSPVIQELAKLGVELYKFDKSPKIMEFLLKQNFSDMKPYIRFLHDTGVPADSIGAFITKNPMIFAESMDDLRTRIRYLRAHEFSVDMIARIVSRNPSWLTFSTKEIDTRLGFFQNEFSLNGSKVRYLAAKQPRLITYRIHHLRENTFAVREEMGFDKDETRSILLALPKLFMRSRRHIVEVFDYAHNTMKLSHDIICRKPNVLNCRLSRLRMRHKYLETLGKNQYDPTKPLYVSPDAIICGTDAEFCLNVAKTTIETYNLFQKTL